MDNNLITNDLTIYNYLKDRVKVIYLTTRQDETQVRCPFCGDSVKSEWSAHLYIQNQPPYFYYCQRCSTSGVVDSELLGKINSYDPTLIKYLDTAQKEYQKGLRFKYGITGSGFGQKQVNLLPETYGERELEKLSYIENRIGIPNFLDHEEDLIKYNVILNLQDFLSNNGFELSSYDTWIQGKIKDLDDRYAMFLLNDKIMINSRNMYPKHDKEKHFKFKVIDDKMVTGRSFFNINLPVETDNRVFNIHMTEGIFDIMSLYANDLIETKNENKNNIYIANNGKGYLFPLSYLQSLGLLNCNINIYSDNDVTVKEIRSRLRASTIAKFNGVNVYYNKVPNVKDFGVPKDQIELSSPIKVTF